MEKIKYLFVGLGVVSCGLNSGNAIAVSVDKAPRPNIVYILADDMGPGDVQAYNKEGKILTPNIDRLAKEGVKFTDPHTNSSVCTPTRYGIMTGRYAWRSSMKSQVLGGYSSHLINDGRETVASFLKKQGYQTACVGKWHLGMDWKSTDGKPIHGSMPDNVDFSAPIQKGPLDFGFDYFFGIAGSLNMDPHAFIENRQIQGTLELQKDFAALEARGFVQPAKPGFVAKEFEQDQVLPTLARKACDWLRKNKDKSFFLYLPLNSPHLPIVPSKEFIGKSGLSLYGDYCMETDWVVGEVLKVLDKLKLSDNTIVVFTSDNGVSPQDGLKEMEGKGHFSSWIYRGLKGTTFEGGHRVPFVIRWPNHTPAGSVCTQPICHTDLLATCADLFHTTLPDSVGEDSKSFLPALNGKTIPGANERIIVHHSDNGIFAVRRGKWTLLLDSHGGSKRTDPKDKPIINPADELLFDMENDVEESTNLSDRYPKVVADMKKELTQVVLRGRSTPGIAQKNDGDQWWEQLTWIPGPEGGVKLSGKKKNKKDLSAGGSDE